jgi:ABC-type multidrug transport system fused ATPase/permease subunit
MLFQSLGKSFIIGFIIYIMIIIILIIVQIKIKYVQRKYMKSKDSRIQMVSKVFDNIRYIKLNTWEEIYENKINEKREIEIKYFSQLQYLQLFLNSIQFSLPPILLLFLYYYIN